MMYVCVSCVHWKLSGLNLQWHVNQYIHLNEIHCLHRHIEKTNVHVYLNFPRFTSKTNGMLKKTKGKLELMIWNIAKVGKKVIFSFFSFNIIVPSVCWADDGLHVSIRYDQFNFNLLKTKRKNRQRLEFKNQNSQIQTIAFWCSDWNLWLSYFLSGK